MPVTRSGYDTTAQAPARERSKITAAAKGTVLWLRDFTSLVFFTGVPNPGFTLWNVSLVLTRYVCYALWLLLITGMIQSLQAEDTGLSNIIDKLVKTQPTTELNHRTKRDIHLLEIQPMDAEKMISQLAGLPVPARGRRSTGKRRNTGKRRSAGKRRSTGQREIHLLEIQPMDAEKMISQLAGLPVLATSTEVPATTSPATPGPPTPATPGPPTSAPEAFSTPGLPAPEAFSTPGLPAPETSSTPGLPTPATPGPPTSAPEASSTPGLPAPEASSTPECVYFCTSATYRISWCVEVSNLSLELTNLTCSSSFMEPLLVVLVVCMASAGTGYVCGHGHSHKRQSVSARPRRKEREEEPGNLPGAV